MEGLGVLEERLANLSARTTSNHDGIGKVRETQAALDKKQALQDAALRELADDMKDLKETVEKQGNRIVAALAALSVTALGSALTFALSSGAHP